MSLQGNRPLQILHIGIQFKIPEYYTNVKVDFHNYEPMVGLEPTTSTLQKWRSRPTELHRQL